MLKSRADRRHRDRQELRARTVPPARRAVPRRRRARARRRGRGAPRRPRRSPRGSAPTCSPRTARSIARSSGRSCSPTARRRELEAIVHPGVYRAIAAGLRAFELIGRDPLRRRRRAAAVTKPDANERFRRVIVTACSPEMQIARLARAGIDRSGGAPAPRGAMADRAEDGARRFRDQHRRHVRGNRSAGR